MNLSQTPEEPARTVQELNETAAELRKQLQGMSSQQPDWSLTVNQLLAVQSMLKNLNHQVANHAG